MLCLPPVFNRHLTTIGLVVLVCMCYFHACFIMAYTLTEWTHACLAKAVTFHNNDVHSGSLSVSEDGDPMFQAFRNFIIKARTDNTHAIHGSLNISVCHWYWLMLLPRYLAYYFNLKPFSCQWTRVREQDIVCTTKIKIIIFYKHARLSCLFSARGGAELLFDGVKEHHVTLPSQSEPCKFNTATPTIHASSIDDLDWPSSVYL